MKIKNIFSPFGTCAESYIVYNTQRSCMKQKLEQLSRFWMLKSRFLIDRFWHQDIQYQQFSTKSCQYIQPDLKITYTNPWTGEIADLKEGTPTESWDDVIHQ